MSLPIIQVFISSTWLDLQPERKAVEAAVHRLRETKFVGLEYFGSRHESTRVASLDEIDRSDVYIGIFAGRYGSGITEDEYRRAVFRGLPCFIYFKGETAIAPAMREEEPQMTERLYQLKRYLREQHITSEFSGPDDLTAKVTADLHRWLFDKYLSPRLELAASGRVSRAETEALLNAIKDLSALDRDLLARLRMAGYDFGGDFVGGDKIVNVYNIYNQPAFTISTLHQLPPPPRDFTGREREIEELLSQIGRGGVTISGLQGLGGIGKTALALKLAERLAPRYPDAQFYLDLKGTGRQPLSVADALSHVIRAYHPTAKLPESEAELQSLYLSALHGQRAILLMDNAAGREQVEPLVPPEGCVLLVTSRQHLHLSGISSLNLEILPPEDARELLLKIAPHIAERADEVASLCGYLPLALRLAASALAERADLSPADYVRRLSDAKKRLELAEASLALSYELLSPERQRLWRALGVFPDTFDAAAAATIWELDADTTQDTLGGLLRYSLLDWDADTSRFRLHDLARLFADSRMSDDERRATRLRHAAHYLTVLRECDDLYLKGGDVIKSGLALFDSEWRNIQAGQAWAEAQTGGDEAAASICSDYPGAGAYLLYLRQYPREQIRWREAALVAARQLKDRGAEGAHLGNLGIAYADLGETRRAIEYHEQALVIEREIGDRRSEGAALGNLGIAYADLGETRRAIEFYTQQLLITREIGDRVGEGQALGRLGVAYADFGETYRAVESYQQALTIFREIGNRRGEASLLIALGQIYEKLADIERAIGFFEGALDISRDMGSLRTQTRVLTRLGALYRSLKQPDRSLSYYAEALALAREIGETPSIADTLLNMANVAIDSQDTERARQYLQESEKLYQQLNSPATAQVSTLLAELESFQGESYRLVETARRFFTNMGVRLVLTSDTQVFRCEISAPSLKKLLPPAVFARFRQEVVFVRFLQGEELGIEKAWAIRKQVLDVDEKAAVVFVITDARPTQAGWAQIGTFPLEKPPFIILPIESVLLNEGLTTGREGELLRKEIEKRVSGRYDPYFVSTPVADTFSFFGREALVNSILRSLEDGQPVGIFGLRKLGKSSVLRALNARAEFPIAKVNLQMVWGDPLDHLFTQIAASWRKWLHVHYEMEWEPPTFDTKGAPAKFADATLDLLGRIEREKGCARLGILFDEIEVIVPRPDGTGADLNRYLMLLRSLRGLIDEDNRLSLVVAGLNPSVGHINSWEDEQNPAFNLFKETYLPPLADEDCVLMVSNIGGQVGLSYDLESLRQISELSGGHPFLARQLCSLLYKMREYKAGEVSSAELPLCVRNYIFKENYVKDLDGGLWQDAGKIALWGVDGAKENQKLLLKLAAAAEPMTETSLLEDAGPDVGRTALHNLEQFHFIHRSSPNAYAITFGLLKKWLRTRKLGLE